MGYNSKAIVALVEKAPERVQGAWLRQGGFLGLKLTKLDSLNIKHNSGVSKLRRFNTDQIGYGSAVVTNLNKCRFARSSLAIVVTVGTPAVQQYLE